MKKLSLIIILVLVLSLVSCATEKNKPADTSPVVSGAASDIAIDVKRTSLAHLKRDGAKLNFVIVHQNGEVSEILNLYMVNENTKIGDSYAFIDVCYVEYYETESITDEFLRGNGDINVISAFKNKVNWTDLNIVDNRLRMLECETVADVLGSEKTDGLALLIWESGVKAINLNKATLGDYKSKELTGDDNGAVSLIIDMFKDRGDDPKDHFGVADSYR